MSFQNTSGLRDLRIQLIRFQAPLFYLVYQLPRYNLTTGNSITGHTRLFTQIKEELKTVIEGPVIVVSAADVLNLQGLLRKIVAESLQIDIPDEEEDERSSTKVSFQPDLLRIEY
jgi:hypothetical protein